jgi:hypothetical protein
MDEFYAAYSLPPSFLENTRVGKVNPIPLSKYNFSAEPPFDLTASFNTELPASLTTYSSRGWTFITAPEDVSWDTANQATRIDMFGTNNPPVVAGSRGMRDLSLGNALVEGFQRNVAVEDKVAALEELMRYDLNASDGFVKVPVYQVKANDKTYGNGYFIIRDVKVKETMRDLKGNTTRAYVDISLMQVPEYQVNSGRDLASKPAASAKALALPDPKATAEQQLKAQNASVTGNVDKNLRDKKAGADAASAQKQPAAEKPPKPDPNTGTRIPGVSRIPPPPPR